MTNISAMRALAELKKIEASRNEDGQVAAENGFKKFSLFGFGFKSEPVNPEEIPPEQKTFRV